MPTLMPFDTAPAEVRELVAMYRYLKHRVDSAIALLTKHKQLVKRDQTLDGLDYQQTYDLIELLHDFQDRMQRLERKISPEECAPKKPLKSNIEPASMALGETLPESSI